jgi:ABC-type amino acid transport substrate-binding protein
MARLPVESFHLFLISGVYCGRVGEVLGVMHLTAISLLAPLLAARGLRVSWGRIAFAAGGSALALLLTVAGTRLLLEQTTTNPAADGNPLAQMRLIDAAPQAEVLRQRPMSGSRAGTTLARIAASGVLRVGYHADNLPFSYFNDRGELVGLDVELAHLLAREMNVELQFVPFQYDTLVEQLQRGEFDVAMSGLPITTPALKRMRFTRPYLETTLSVVTRDHRRREFASIDAVAAQENLHIAVLRSEYYAAKVRGELPDAEVSVIVSPREFFDDGDDRFDALAMTAESGSAWTLLYPEFQVVVVQPELVHVPLGFALAIEDEEFGEFLSHWIELTRGGQPYARAYRHWIEGEDFRAQHRRWSIGRNVLGWLP